MVFTRLQTCFNRNIVECKFRESSDILPSIIVLIETLWNVNLHIGFLSATHSSVLIETLWNVNG